MAKKFSALYFASQGSNFDVARESELLVTKSTQSCSMDICEMHVRISQISPSKKRSKKTRLHFSLLPQIAWRREMRNPYTHKVICPTCNRGFCTKYSCYVSQRTHFWARFLNELRLRNVVNFHFSCFLRAVWDVFLKAVFQRKNKKKGCPKLGQP